MKQDLEKQGTGFGIKELRVDGGACLNNFLMQFQADILDVTVDRPAMIESTSLGAAYLAGLGCGLWPSAEALAKLRKTDRKFTPSMTAARRVELCHGWKAAVGRVRAET